jgi:hypothetical protein
VLLYQPLALVVPMTVAAMLGAVRSMLMPVTVADAVFPARSMAVPLADWLVPSPLRVSRNVAAGAFGEEPRLRRTGKSGCNVQQNQDPQSAFAAGSTERTQVCCAGSTLSHFDGEVGHRTSRPHVGAGALPAFRFDRERTNG